MTTLVQRSPVEMAPPSSQLLRHPGTYTMEEVKKHHDHTSCWIVVDGKVYDATQFLQEHPGGSDIILEYAGGDASAAFIDKGHSRDAFTMLSKYYIGQLIQESQQG